MIAAVAITAPAITAPHVFPDGHVERTVAVIVRDRTLHLEYSVGMNDVTMQRMIETWKTPASPNPGSPSGKSNDETDSDPDSATESSQQPFDFDLIQNAKKEVFENDAEITATFKELATAQIAKRLVVKFGDAELKLKPVANPIATRRHMSLTMEFEVQLPLGETGIPSTEKASVAKPILLEIIDRNFLGSFQPAKWEGAIRTSLKAAGNAMLVKSDAAPILVRADRVELTGQSVLKRTQAATISGVLILPVE